MARIDLEHPGAMIPRPSQIVIVDRCRADVIVTPAGVTMHGGAIQWLVPSLAVLNAEIGYRLVGLLEVPLVQTFLKTDLAALLFQDLRWRGAAPRPGPAAKPDDFHPLLDLLNALIASPPMWP